MDNDDSALSSKHLDEKGDGLRHLGIVERRGDDQTTAVSSERAEFAELGGEFVRRKNHSFGAENTEPDSADFSRLVSR